VPLIVLMAEQRFKHIISLGQSCQTIYQIKRQYKIKDTNLFDNKRTSIELLTALLNNDFKDLILPSNLSISDDREYIIDNKYNFWLRHEFRNEQGIIINMKIPGRPLNLKKQLKTGHQGSFLK
jgi:hypothetical protein